MAKQFICVRDAKSKDINLLKKLDQSFIRQYGLSKEDIYDNEEGYQPEELRLYLDCYRRTLLPEYDRQVSKLLKNNCTGIQYDFVGYWL
jgi:hypothetical protein